MASFNVNELSKSENSHQTISGVKRKKNEINPATTKKKQKLGIANNTAGKSLVKAAPISTDVHQKGC